MCRMKLLMYNTSECRPSDYGTEAVMVDNEDGLSNYKRVDEVIYCILSDVVSPIGDRNSIHSAAEP